MARLDTLKDLIRQANEGKGSEKDKKPVSNGQADFGINYVTSNRFYVEMESTIAAAFSECQGLGVQIDKETIFEGGALDQQRILLKQAKFSDVTLKRGMTDDLAFWSWIDAVIDAGTVPQRRNIRILVFNQAGETMQCWTLIGAVPVGWKAPALKADAKSLAIEELTLAYEGLKVERRAGGSGSVSVVKRDPKSGYFPGN